MSARRLARLRRIALVLPEAEERETWGEVTFRVRDKMFGLTGYDAARISLKATLDDQAALVATDPSITVAPYVGKHGWVSVDLTGSPDWALVEDLVRESWRLVAPKRLAASDGGAGRVGSPSGRCRTGTAPRSDRNRVGTNRARRT